MALADIRWLYSWPDMGPASFRIGRAGDDVVAEWIGVATLTADKAGTRSDFRLSRAPESPHVEEHLREHAAALLRHLHGEISLHGSCAARGALAIICVGESGAGKSTLAAQLCLDPSFELLADDTAALRFDGPRIEVVPTERTHRLCPDVATVMGLSAMGQAKVLKDAERPAKVASRLGAIVMLAFDGAQSEPSIKRVRGSRAFPALSRAVFRFALDVPEVLKSELDRLSRLAEDIPIFELVRPPDLTHLTESRRIVLDLFDQLSKTDAVSA